MDAIELAERKARARASAYLVFAGLDLALLLVGMTWWRTDFVNGMWVGLTLVAALNMLPFARWLRPGRPVTRLLDDEATRAHRGMSATAGFCAAVGSGLILSFVTADPGVLSAFDVSRLIVTAALVAALTGFAVLELRAARG